MFKKPTYLKWLIALIMTVFLWSGHYQADAQCLTSPYGMWGSLTPICNGITQNVTTCGYCGEYSNVTLNSGETYTFTSSVPTDYITISNSAGSVAYAWGTTPVVWTSTVTGTLRFYTHVSSACGAQGSCRIRAIKCGTPAPGKDCSTAFSYGNINDPAINSATTGAGDLFWYEFTGSQDMTVTVSLCGSAFDTMLELWYDCGNATYAFGNDDGCGGYGSPSIITGIPFTAGDVMYVKVKGWSTSYGNFTLNITGIADPGDIEGYVYDSSMEPIAGATVQVAAQGVSTTTNALGYYELTGIENGDREVKASKPGYWAQTYTVNVIAYNVVQQDFVLAEAPPVLVELPETTNLGFWALGAWQEGTTIQAINMGGSNASITSLDLDDPSGFYSFTAPALPVNLATGESIDIHISFNAPLGSSTGVYNATLVASYGPGARDVAAGNLIVTAYDPPPYDVVENAIEFTIFEPPLAPVEIQAPASREFGGYYKNYILPNDLGPSAEDNDLVFKFTAEADVLFDFWSGGAITNIAIYAEDFNGEGGPMADNALAQDLGGIYDFPMFIGTYYVVLGAEGDWVSASFNFNYMEAPLAVTNVAPLDGATDIENGDLIEWTYNGDPTEEYQLILGTTYPPNTIAVPWTTAGAVGDSYELADLQPNMQYFWQVIARNNVDVSGTPGEIWGFTTTISRPLNLEAANDELFVGQSVVLSWDAVTGDDRAFIGYNVYRDGSQINDEPVTATTFTDAELGALVYNMVPGYTYNVTSLFDEGESAFSNDVVVQFSGNGTMAGTVTDVLTTAAIYNATVTFTGKDEFGNNVSYSTTTNASGAYTKVVKAGLYDVTVVASGYNNGFAEDLTVTYGATTTQNFALVETPYPVESVTAVEVNTDSVQITWVPNSSRELLGYTISRQVVLQEPPFTVTNTEIGTTTGAILHDDMWGDQEPGVYRWFVVSNYENGNNSVPVYSNTLDKEMETVVNFVVTTEFGDSPEATVTFTNITEPALDLEYTTTLDATGTGSFDPFRKGTYNIEVALYGYMTIIETGVVIWEETDFEWELLGGTPAPENLTAADDSLYMGEDAKLSWDAPASNEFKGYIVYRDGVALFDIPISDLFYTDAAPPYNMDPSEYTVKAFYLSGGISADSDPEEVWVTGEGSVDGMVTDARTDDPVEGAQVRLNGFDEFGFPRAYVFSTDADGEYADEDGVWAGVYDYSVEAAGYDAGTATDVDVFYDETTTEDFILFPSMEVTATELDDNTVLIEWLFVMDESRELIGFEVYRSLWDVNVPMGWTLLGTTVGNSFLDTDWGTVESGVYKWVVVTTYDDGTTVTYSNYLDKDMETVVNVEVVLNSAESAAGVSVTLTNISEPYLELAYELTLDATGMATIDPFRKGLYEIEVSKFGFATLYDLQDIQDVTDLYYVLIENITAVSNLYVDPNGYATWDMPTPGGLDMFATDFTGGIPSSITIENFGDIDGIWEYEPNNQAAMSWWAYPTDTRMNTPKVALDNNTVVQFKFAELYVYDVTSTRLTIEISFNEGLTWTEIWSWDDLTFPASTWIQTTIDLGALGYTSGDAMFSAHKTDDNGWPVLLDNWYIGPADVAAESIAISSQGVIAEEGMDKSDFNVANAMSGVEMFSNNSLASTVNNNGSRSLETFKVYLDGIFSGETLNMFYDYEVEETLVEGTEYTAKVEAVYTTGVSEPMYYTFIYHACDYYNSVSDFTAERVMGTMDIALAWTNDDEDVDADEFIGTNIYRDGELLDFVAAGTEMYTDADVASGTYNYCVTQVYESDAQSCEVCAGVIMTGGGYVNGYVTSFDPAGVPIEGATVALVGGTDSYVFTTDALGYYEGEAVEGTYTYTVSAPEYASEVLAGVFIDFGATVTRNFALKEFPYPVGEVVATELNDNTVQVNWSGQGGTTISEWLMYDNGTNTNNLGTTAAFTIAWANKFEPAQLTAFNNCAVTELMYYGYNNNAAITSIQVMIWSGGNVSPATLLYSEDVTSQVSYTNVWNEIMLASAVPFDNTESLWIGFYAEASGLSYPSSLGPQVAPTTNGDWYSFNAGAWSHGNAIVPGTAWNIHSLVTNEYGRVTAMTPMPGPARLGKAFPDGQLASVANLNPEASRLYGTLDLSSRAIAGYNVYRGPCHGSASDMVFLGYTLDQQFTDNTWGGADAGMYTWAVEVVYDHNTSEYAYSNCLDKDMITQVSVTVTTNSLDSPEETEVMFTNTSEPDLGLVYETMLDATGYYAWDEFRKGTYDIHVELNGFAPISIMGYVIDGPEAFEWVLEELLLPVSDLHVTPNGYATWRDGGIIPPIPFEPKFDNFDEGLPSDWTVDPVAMPTWFWTTDDVGSTLDGTPFMFVDSDAAGIGVFMQVTLTSPVIENTENADALFLEFDQYYNTGYDDAAYGNVEVFDGNDWVVLLHQTADIGYWSSPDHQVIDVTEYANPAFQVRFFYSATWDYYWAVDNIAVTDGSDRYADRMLEYYQVWLDGVFVVDTENPFWQYDIEELVPGQQYLSEVSAMYSTGMSAKMQYEWTYIPCEEFPGPDYLTAEVENVNDVMLDWAGTAPPPPVVLVFEPFEDYNAGDNLAEQAYAMGRDYWTTWSGTLGGPEDPMVSDAQAFEGSKSVVINGSNDAVLLLDNYTEGVFNVDFYIYIPTGKTGYFNILQQFVVDPITWGLEVYFNAAGAGLVHAGGPGTGAFTYTYDTWHNVSVDIDLDNDYAEMFLNGNSVVSWVWSTGATGTTTLNQFNAMDFFAAASTDGAFYDNINVTMEATPPPPGGDFVEDFEAGTLPAGWAVYDVDGDGYIWDNTAVEFDVYDAHTGLYCMTSASYRNDVGALTPNNWLVTPAIAVTDQSDLHFWVDAQDPAWADEQYYVKVSTTGNAVGDFTNTIHSAMSPQEWAEVVLDLSTFAGETIYIAFQHANVTDMYFIKIDDVTVTNTATRAAYTQPLAAGVSQAIPFKAEGMSQAEIDARLASITIDASTVADNGRFGRDGHLGANIYRNGELIADMVQGETYTDPGVAFGDYTYCVTFVYEDGAESCQDVCADVEVSAPQIAVDPESLSAVLEPGGTSEDVLTVLNNGNGLLNFSLTIEYDSRIPVKYVAPAVHDPASFIEGTSLEPINRDITCPAGSLISQPATDFASANTADEDAGYTVFQSFNGGAQITGLRFWTISAYFNGAWVPCTGIDPRPFTIGFYNDNGGEPGTLVEEFLLELNRVNTGVVFAGSYPVYEYTATLPSSVTLLSGWFSVQSMIGTAVNCWNLLLDTPSGTGQCLQFDGTSYTATVSPLGFCLIGSTGWLTVNPLAGSIDGVGQLALDVTFDATDLEVGSYTANIIITSNDPVNPTLIVPVLLDLTTGIGELDKDAVRLYPNPAKDNFTVEAKNMQRITMVNSIGQVLYDSEPTNQNKVILNTAGYNTGVYMVRIVTADGMVTKRVIIAR